jgi:hypothetical protein
MKIIEKDESILKEENEKNAYLLGLSANADFQRYYVQGVLLPVLNSLRDLRWMYQSDEKLMSATDEEIAGIIRSNRTHYRSIVSLLSPIVDDDTKKTL